MNDERQLTKEDREKIQRLLESGTLGNVTLALSLIEELAGPEDIADLFTMNVIVELICLGDPVLQAASIMRKCPNTSKVFVKALTNQFIMTSRDYRSRNTELSEFTNISSAALTDVLNDEYYIDLSGLTSLSTVSAEHLSKHTGDLYLNGLTELSDTATELLSKREGALYLKSLTKLSDAAAVQLDSCSNLNTNPKIRRQIKKAVSTRNQQARHSAKTGKTALTKTQAVKLRKLFRSKDADNVVAAVQLVNNSGATHDDISDLLSSSVLSLLVNTWDVNVWNALAPLLLSYPNAKREFTALTNKRVRKKFKPNRYTQETEEFVAGFYRDVNKPLSLLGLNIVDVGWGVGGDLTQLSDAAAESLSKHEGDLDLCGLTSLSDAAAESLANKVPKFNSWQITLDTLPASAAQILRDAGHGE